MSCLIADSLTTAGHLAGRFPAPAESGPRSSSRTAPGPVAGDPSGSPSCVTSWRTCRRHERPRPTPRKEQELRQSDPVQIIWTSSGVSRREPRPRVMQYAGVSWILNHLYISPGGIKRLPPSSIRVRRNVDRRPDRRRWARVRNLDGWGRLWCSLLALDSPK